MGIYKQKGSKVWQISYTYRGVQIRRSTKTTNKKIAEEIYYKTKSDIFQGIYWKSLKGKDKTFKDLANRYLKEFTPYKKPTSQKDDKRYAKNWINCFGDSFLDEISSDEISQYIQNRKEIAGPCTTNRELAFLSVAFNKGVKIWKWCRDNPVSGIPREKEPVRVKYFSDEESFEIFKNLAEWVKPIVILAKKTGLRTANLVNLKWNQVDLKNNLIIIEAEEMKNSQPLGVPLIAEAIKVLKDQLRIRKIHDSYVFW